MSATTPKPITQIDFARAGIVTPQMKTVAEKEGRSVEYIRERVAAGSIAIPANIHHTSLSAEGVGEGLRTKVNVNLGISGDLADEPVEWQKVETALELGAEAIMDLSNSGKTQAFRTKLIEKSPAMIGTVPMFFMMSGATLMDYRKRYSTKKFFQKRFMRTVIPWLVWSCLGAVWMSTTHGVIPASITEVASNILGCKDITIFWFFPNLFAVYLAIPLLSLIPESKRRSGFGYTIVVAFITISVLPTICELLGISWNSSLQIPVAAGDVIYVLIGYWVNTYKIPRKWRYVLYIAGFLGLLLHIAGTWMLSYDAGEIVKTFKGTLNFPCVLYATAIFVAFRNLESKPYMDKLGKLCKPLAGLCLGVYLLQFFFLDSVTLFTSIDTFRIAYRIGGAVVIFASCLFLTWALKKIPIIRHAMG